ncbi:unnamed protein product [Brassica oleracea]
MKGVVNLLESENRTQFSKKSKKSRPVREPVRAPSVESLSASDESEREGSDREGSEREVYILYSLFLLVSNAE